MDVIDNILLKRDQLELKIELLIYHPRLLGIYQGIPEKQAEFNEQKSNSIRDTIYTFEQKHSILAYSYFSKAQILYWTSRDNCGSICPFGKLQAVIQF